MIAVKQGTGIAPPAVRYEYTYSYDFQPEKDTPTRKTTTALDMEKSPDSKKCPLDLLSSAASAVVDDEESSSVASSSSTSQSQRPQGILSSSSTLSSSPSSPPTLQTQALHARHPPVAYVVRHSPPTAYAVSPGASPKLLPKLPPTAAAPLGALPVFPPQYRTYAARSLPIPQGMQISLNPTKETLLPRSIHNRNVASKASAFVAKVAPKNTAKYKMKYHYVSMKRSEAMKYIEAVSQIHSNPQYYVGNINQNKPIPAVCWNKNQSPVLARNVPVVPEFRPVSIPATTQVYRLPLARAVVPPY